MVSKQKRPCGDKDKSKVNVRYQSRDELLIKLKMLEKDRKCLYAKDFRLSERVRKVIKKDGMCVDEETSEVSKETIAKKVSENPFQEDSPQHLLWEKQKLQASKKDNRAMVWHPLIIR